MDPLTLALQLGTTVGGYLLGNRGRLRGQTNVDNQLSYLDSFYLPLMQQLGLGTFDPGRQAILDQLGALGPGGFNPVQQGIFNQAQSMFGGGQLTSPTLGGIPWDLNGTLGPGANERYGVGMELLQNRGQTADTRFLMDRVGDLFNGARNDPRLNAASAVAFEGPGGLLSGGRTAETGQAIKSFLDIIGAGGQTSQTRGLFGAGMGLINSGGMTPALREIMSQAQGLISQGGMTPEARQLFSTLMPIIQAGGRGGALMPEGQALSFARDAAATANAQQAEAARRQAFQRGGGAGAVVANGMQNQALAEFGDQAARNEAAALREAATQQQALQLQQLLGTGQIAGDISRQAMQLIGQLQGTLGSVASASASNLATGANLGIGSQQLANQRLGTGVSGLDAMLGQELGRFNAASNLFLGTEAQRRQMEQTGMNLGLGVGNLEMNRMFGGADILNGLTNQGLQFRGQNLQNQQFNAGQGMQYLQFLNNMAAQAQAQGIDLGQILLNNGTTILGGPFAGGVNQRGQILTSPTGIPGANPAGNDLLNFGLGSMSSVGLGGWRPGSRSTGQRGGGYDLNV